MQDQKLPKTVKLEEEGMIGIEKREVIRAEKRKIKALKVGNAFIVPYIEDGLKFYFLVKQDYAIDTGYDESDAADAFFELVELLKTTSKIEQVEIEADAFLIKRTLYNKHTNVVDTEDYYWVIEWQDGDSVYAIKLNDVEQLAEEL